MCTGSLPTTLGCPKSHPALNKSARRCSMPFALCFRCTRTSRDTLSPNACARHVCMYNHFSRPWTAPLREVCTRQVISPPIKFNLRNHSPPREFKTRNVAALTQLGQAGQLLLKKQTKPWLRHTIGEKCHARGRPHDWPRAYMWVGVLPCQRLADSLGCLTTAPSNP